MKTLVPDDFEVGMMVTVVRGPFNTITPQFPPAMYGETGKPPTVEDKSLHGRVFRLETTSPLFVILEPLDGVGDMPPTRQVGEFMLVPRNGQFAPTGAILSIKDGNVTLAQVDDEYVAAYRKHFCAPPRPTATTPAVVGPLGRGFSDDCGCADDANAHQCKISKGTPDES